MSKKRNAESAAKSALNDIRDAERALNNEDYERAKRDLRNADISLTKAIADIHRIDEAG